MDFIGGTVLLFIYFLKKDGLGSVGRRWRVAQNGTKNYRVAPICATRSQSFRTNWTTDDYRTDFQVKELRILPEPMHSMQVVSIPTITANTTLDIK